MNIHTISDNKLASSFLNTERCTDKEGLNLLYVRRMSIVERVLSCVGILQMVASEVVQLAYFVDT